MSLGFSITAAAHEKRDSFSLFFQQFPMRADLSNPKTIKYIQVVHDIMSVHRIITTYRDTMIPQVNRSKPKFSNINDSAHTIWTWRRDIIHRKHDTLFMVKLRQEDIRYIIALLDMNRDTSIFIWEKDMYGGWGQNLTITANGYQAKYSMWNQGDSISYKIIQVLNKYLPEAFKISPLLQDWDAFFESLQRSLMKLTPEE